MNAHQMCACAHATNPSILKEGRSHLDLRVCKVSSPFASWGGAAVSDEPWCAGEQRPYPAGLPIITVALTQPQPRTTVCTVTGVINADTASPLNDALARAQNAGAHLVIDLSAATFLDSDGLYILLVARHRHRTGGGGHLAVVIDPDSPAIPELCIVSLKASFDLHHTVAEAIHACANTGIQP